MNIFYLDKDPVIAAQMSCDKHCVKMILESAQMLSTAHRVLDGDKYADDVGLYKMAHKNHPSTIWVRSSSANYDWLWKHMRALMREYTHRYGKIHATERLNEPLAKLPTNINFGNLYVDVSIKSITLTSIEEVLDGFISPIGFVLKLWTWRLELDLNF